MTHSDAYQRFQSSRNIGYQQWHDGAGYDMEAFAAMTPAERDAEADAAIANVNPDWRDLEVLAAHGGRKCIEHLRGLLLHPSIETRAHALGELIDGGHTPGAVPDVQLAHIIDAIDNENDEGMTQALLLAQSHAGPISKLALLRGAKAKPALALHFVAALMDLAELSDDMAAFDPKFRPLLLRLLPDNAPADRAAAFGELCRLLGIDSSSIPSEDESQRWAWAERCWPRA
jgi:hypothetical protein